MTLSTLACLTCAAAAAAAAAAVVVVQLPLGQVLPLSPNTLNMDQLVPGVGMNKIRFIE